MAQGGWWRSVGPRLTGVRWGVVLPPTEARDGTSAQPGVPPDRVTAQLNTAVAMAHTELARADLKAQALLAGTSAALIIGVAALGGDKIPTAAKLTGWGAIGIALVAVVLLALAIRPHLKGRFGLLRYPRMSVAEVVDEAVLVGEGGVEGHRLQAEEVRGFALLALRKYRIVRHALNLLGVSMVLTLISTVVTVTGGG